MAGGTTIPNALTVAVDSAVGNLRVAWEQLQNDMVKPGCANPNNSAMSAVVAADRATYDSAYNALQTAIANASGQAGYTPPPMPPYGNRI